MLSSFSFYPAGQPSNRQKSQHIDLPSCIFMLKKACLFQNNRKYGKKSVSFLQKV